MNLRQKYSGHLAGSLGLFILATTFSACVPVEPPPPAAETRLNFVVGTDDATGGEVLKSLNPVSGEITDITRANTNVGIVMISGQPNGSAILHFTGVSFGSAGGIGNYYTIAENAAGQYVRRLVKPGDGQLPPEWSPDGTRLAWIQDNNLYVALLGAIRTPIGSATLFKWSPDGRKIIYSKPAAGGVTAHVYDVATGQDSTVIDETYGDFASDIGYFTWLSDNRHVIVSSGRHILIDSTTPVPATYQDLGASTAEIIPSPSSDRFILASDNSDGSTRTYSLVFADGRAAVPLVGASAWPQPGWSVTGDHIYFVADVDANGILDAVTTSAEGQIQQTIAADTPISDYLIYSSPQHDRMAFIHLDDEPYNFTIRLVVIDLAAGDAHAFDPVSINFFEPLIDASWSPDGKFFAWGNRDHSMYLYDTAAPDSLSRSINLDQYLMGVRTAAWSQDSRHLAICHQADAYTCFPAVISVTSGNLTYRKLPGFTTQNVIWTGK